MSTTTEQLPAVGQAKQYIGMAKDRLLKTLSFVPDDKLNWTPASGAKSALRVAAHCGCSNAAFLMIVKGEKMPEMPREEMLSYMEASETAISTREDAIALIESSTDTFLSQLDTLTAEQVDSIVPTPMFTAPMAFWMNLPGRHMDNHASQIDYLQTCWGDQEWHI